MTPRRRTRWLPALALVALLGAPLPPVAAQPGAAATRSTSAEQGTWRVQALGGGRYAVSWTSPRRLPVADDRPAVTGPSDLLIGVSTVAADGRTVRTIVTADRRPDPADLDVVLSGDQLDQTGDDLLRPGSASGERLDLPGTETLSVDPGAQGPYGIVRSDYQLDPVKLPGMRQPIEMVGHVVEPAPDAVTGPRPLVLFLHGRHSYCYDPSDDQAWGDEWPCQPPMQEIPSQLGYDYIQRVLASQGFATVSVRVNGINAQDYRLPDGGAGARAAIVERHLDYWAGIAAEHQVDLNRVVLVGHSRGGEGVDRASIEIPLSAPYRIVGQVLIAPTDFAGQTAPYVPTVTLLPYCDGDVMDLQGQRFTDVARDIAAGDTSLKSSVLVMGANHNFFNTEWTPGVAQAPSWDDWPTRSGPCGRRDPDRLSAGQQRAVGTAYVAGAVRLFADHEQDLLPLFDGSRATVASAGDAQVLSSAIGGGRELRRADRGTSLDLPVGARTRFCRGVVDQERVASCAYRMGYGPITPHWIQGYERAPSREFFEMTWSAAGQSGGLLLDQPLDLSTDRLELRTILDPRYGDADLRVRIADATGASALLTPAGGGVLPALPGGRSIEKLWAQTVVVDPGAATGVDLSRITRVDLVPQNPRGRLWLADLAAAPATLAAVPDRRVPVVDIGRLQVQEGDGRGTAIARVPFRISGAVTRPARLVVGTFGQRRGDVQRFTVDLAPGQTSGSIPVAYERDTFDDFPRLATQVAAWPQGEVMTGSWLGDLTVLDDDPTPRVRVRTVPKRVAEGLPAQWLVRMDKPVDYDIFVSARVVRGPGRPVTTRDVSAHWLAAHGVKDDGQPLWRHHLEMYEIVRGGNHDAGLVVPTRRDQVRDAGESITLRVRIDRRTYLRTVYVGAPA